ncbi:MAG: hypothetical protein AAFU73_17065 [Planctomycetota bacterium]
MHVRSSLSVPLLAGSLLVLPACSGGSGSAGPDGPAGPDIASGAYLADGGLVVVEFESGPAPGSWATETGLAGFTGASYLTWTGPNLYSTPGTDTFGFDLWIEEAGTYDFRIHNRHDDPDSTLSNDLWARMDGGDWVKVFSWERGTWTWATQHEFSASNKPPAEYELTAGNHRIEFSGRSSDFSVDRFHLYLDSVSNPLDTSHPESQRHGASTLPPPMSSATLDPSTSRTTLVELDAGDAADVEWRIGAGDFADGTRATDALVRVVLPGGVAVPVERTVDGVTEWTILHPEGATLRFAGEPIVGGRLEVSGAGTVEFVGPDGFSRASAALEPDVPGLWTARREDGGTLGVHVLSQR